MSFVQEMIAQYGYTALYVLLALGIVGIPIPDELLMTFVGYLTSLDLLDYPIALTVSFMGAMTGMTCSYWAGRHFGKPLLWKYGKWVKLTPKRLGKAEKWFNRYGLWTVSFGYFIPGIRHLICYLSGVSGMNQRKYLLYAGFGALFWCLCFITLGYFVGSQFDFSD
ncbi:DedA family protein [Paenibacillus mesophilus]|uniref:DedA family protein n=1 Tax=Paenibacillus mesophilus TaxID=2582849 RepID=UPI00110D3F65|nr:DedA family protein [Paenibacillus mesophilus]TMV46586.1 DedA family protein [Paenibacillus mesophilus]